MKHERKVGLWSNNRNEVHDTWPVSRTGLPSVTLQSGGYLHTGQQQFFKQWVMRILLVRNLVTESQISCIVRFFLSSLNVFLQKHCNSVLNLTFSGHTSVYREHASGQALHSWNSKIDTLKQNTTAITEYQKIQYLHMNMMKINTDKEVCQKMNTNVYMNLKCI
jgi:uncharacterized protein YecE (DUF72 family)